MEFIGLRNRFLRGEIAPALWPTIRTKCLPPTTADAARRSLLLVSRSSLDHITDIKREMLMLMDCEFRPFPVPAGTTDNWSSRRFSLHRRQLLLELLKLSNCYWMMPLFLAILARLRRSAGGRPNQRHGQ